MSLCFFSMFFSLVTLLELHLKVIACIKQEGTMKTVSEFEVTNEKFKNIKICGEG